MKTQTDLKILLVEDSPNDAELIVQRLHGDGLAFTHQRVATAELLVRELTEFDPDILLCDNRMPNFDAMSVIEIVAEMRPHLPIIIVTGTLDDEAAAGLIKAGATDFIRKDRMARLPAAVTSALEGACDRNLRREQAVKLRENELILRLALGATGQGVWRLELGRSDDGLEWDAVCNALLGFDSGILTNYAVWAKAIDSTDRARVLAQVRIALDPANSLDDLVSEFRVTRADGTMGWLAAAGRAMFEPDPAGPAGRRPVRIVGTVRDVSQAKAIEQERQAHEAELQRARETAEQASQAKSRFLAGVSHELRTPLHGIIGYAELLIMEDDLNAVQSQRVETIVSAGQHLLGLINAVLDMSQIEADQLKLSPVEIELDDLVRDCFDMVRTQAAAKGLSLVLKSAAPRRLSADPTRLKQVLINLLGNAVKFTTAGTVEVRLRPTAEGDGTRFEIADTGPGIGAGHRDKLFRAFERLDSEAVSGIEGAGLGLALAARLVHLMGGSVGYDNNAGGGSLFWFELPRGPAASVAHASVTPARPRRPAPLRVLVADDEAMNRDIARGFLSHAGYEVVCVDGGLPAVEAAATEHFDVVLMDVRMPGVDGLEATRRIRALGAPHGKVRIVAVTAQAFAEQIEICREVGMDSHVAKPFTQSVLLGALLKGASTGAKAKEAVLS